MDYTAGPQNLTGGLLSDGSPGIVINPGNVTINSAIGNPVQHANTLLVRSNLSVILNLTNGCEIERWTKAAGLLGAPPKD